VRLVSWNIHGGIGRDGRRDLGRVAAVLRELNADVAALQEVGDAQRPAADADHTLADHAAELARLLGWFVAYGPTLVRAGRPYGNAVLSRFPIGRARNYDLSIRGREPRGCLRADLEVEPASSLHLFNLHWGLSGGERRRQAAMLLSADLLRDTALTAPLVVCGDFNMWMPVPGPIARLLRTQLRDVAVMTRTRRATWPARLPLLRLDRAYVDSGVQVLGAGVGAGTAASASDHLPLWVDLIPLPQRGADAGSPAVAGTRTGA
jgi:endonuclease/exonuclease/phosphatase family metal-dependent hydrolase